MAASHTRLCLPLPRLSRQDATFGGGSVQFGRRDVSVLLSLAPLWYNVEVSVAARERRNRKEIPIEDFNANGDGVKYLDLEEGRGPVAQKGDSVVVHFDCVFRGITAVSSRESKLLGGNRIIAQPYELVVGSAPGKERKREFVDNANGLFSAQAAPKPPPALYNLVEGMHVGGKRRVIVTPDLGYGNKGINEIPPNATFELNIELLTVKNT